MPEAEVKFDDVFEGALQDVLGGPEIAAAATAQRPGADLQDAARRWRSTVQRRTSAEQADYLRSRAEAADLQARRRRYQTANIVLFTLAVLVLFLFILLVYQLYAHTTWVVALALAAVVVVGAALLWPRGDEDRQRLQAWRKTLRVPSWSAQDGHRFSTASDAVEETTTGWRMSIAEAIMARLLAHMAVASYSLELGTLPAGTLPAGLRESLDTSFHVQTETGLRLARLIGDLNGGSYALVGARGTGKTELLGALALGAYDDEGAAPLLTVQLSAPVSYVPRDFVLQLFAETCSQTIDLVRVCLADPDLEPTLAAELQALRTRAEDQRQHVLNQATSSLEASAAANVGPLGVGLRRNVSQSRLAYTYPEVVSELRRFLEHVASVLARYAPQRGKPGREVEVVVAIDELDRMEGPEQARAFLHEVKGVLGVRNCCFIVSMAEESLQSYDRDGKPLDDLLTRAFDEIVHMTYLDLPTCGSLLASRASPPFPEQFVGLCFCLAGGIARNVIRTARGVVGTALQPGNARLSRIAAAIVESEMRGTVNWARARLARLDGASATGAARFLDEWVHTRAPGATPRDRLLQLATLAREAGDPDEVGFICSRVLATAQFMVTVLEVFDDDLDYARYDRGRREVPFAGSFESLARARRRLPVNDRLVREMVHAFRAAWQLPELAWW